MNEEQGKDTQQKGHDTKMLIVDEKKPYESPELTKLGDVTELTRQYDVSFIVE